MAGDLACTATLTQAVVGRPDLPRPDQVWSNGCRTGRCPVRAQTGRPQDAQAVRPAGRGSAVKCGAWGKPCPTDLFFVGQGTDREIVWRSSPCRDADRDVSGGFVTIFEAGGPMPKDHTYTATVTWTGNRGEGTRSYRS